MDTDTDTMIHYTSEPSGVEISIRLDKKKLPDENIVHVPLSNIYSCKMCNVVFVNEIPHSISEEMIVSPDPLHVSGDAYRTTKWQCAMMWTSSFCTLRTRFTVTSVRRAKYDKMAVCDDVDIKWIDAYLYKCQVRQDVSVR
jgi:hypothetical protein